jgi:hypothetical protein
MDIAKVGWISQMTHGLQQMHAHRVKTRFVTLNADINAFGTISIASTRP